jgi:predicted MFS family arabinose efflux permease
MISKINFNVYLLALAQACLLSTTMTVVTYAGLAGKMLAPSPALATLPISLMILTTAVTTGMVSGFMGRRSRKAGFFLGIYFGIAGALISFIAIWLAIFWLLCIGVALIGIFSASGQYYRYAAIESMPASQSGKAVSVVMLGGLLAAVLAPSITGVFMDTFQPNIYMGSFLFITFVILCAILPISRLALVATVVSEKVLAKGTSRPLPEVIRQKVFLAAVLNSAAGFAIMSFVMSATPLAMEICGFGPDVSKHVIQAHVIAMFLPSLFTGYLIDRFGIVKILLSGHALLAVALVVAYIGIEIENFSVALLFLGVGWNFCFIGGTALLVRSYRECEKPKVQGLNETLVYICQGIASLGAGAALYYLGWASLIQIAIVMLAVTSIFTILYAFSPQRETDHESHRS